ncbi:MAG: DUF2281 domain-containing protein [Candidatus Brocadia sp.]|nr:DUF2281 domain-containing protein [Candidatus Brocadia sp.]
MSVITDYKRELMTITQDLPDKEVREVLDFARFLKAKKEGFSYTQHIEEITLLPAYGDN